MPTIGPNAGQSSKAYLRNRKKRPPSTAQREAASIHRRVTTHTYMPKPAARAVRRAPRPAPARPAPTVAYPTGGDVHQRTAAPAVAHHTKAVERKAARKSYRIARNRAHRQLNQLRDELARTKDPRARAFLSKMLGEQRGQTRPMRLAYHHGDRAIAMRRQEAALQLLAKSRQLHLPKGVPASQRDLYARSPAQLHKLGFHQESLLDKAMKAPAGIIGSAVALGEAGYHDPVGVTLKTAKQATLAIPASLGGLIDLARHPAKTTSQGVKSFLARVDQPVSAKVKRIRKEGGFADAADVATVLAPAGAAARAGLLESLPERAALRVSGDLVKARRRTGVARTVAGHQLDKRKAAKLDRQLAAAEKGGPPIGALEHAAAKANRKAGRPVELPARRAAARQRRAVATARSRAVYQLKHDQATRLGHVNKQLNRLNAREKKALFYSVSMGIRTPEAARDLLPGLRERMIAQRMAEGVRVTGRLHKSDMLPGIDAILAKPEAHFTPRLAEVTEALRPESMRAAREDPRLVTGQREARRFKDQQAVLGLGGIHPDELAAATRAGAQAHGLAAPMYFRSERYVGAPDFASRALGGRRAMKADFSHRGRNLAVGLQDTRPEQFTTGLARNIKARHNWRSIEELVSAHRFTQVAPPNGTTLSDLRARLAAEGIDEGSVAYWNPGVFRAAARRAEDDTLAGDLAGPEAGATAAAAGLRQASFSPGEPLPTGELAATSGWQAVPTEVLREIERETTPSTAVGRGFDIAKGKTSRALLLSANVPWATYQVISNAGVAGAASRGRALNAANWLGAARWWHSMDDADKQRIGATLGLDSAGYDHTQVRLGASSNSDLVNAYRAFKAHPFWHTGIAKGRGPSISGLNPLEAMARFDRKQNNTFRLLTAYSRAKPQAVREMGKAMGRTDRLQSRLTHVLALPPHEQVTRLLRDPTILEKHAEAVNDWLGDYTSMTAFERKGINRLVMFYPYLRYSLRLVLYTLPVKHPAVTAMLAQLGQLHADELRQLLGGDNIYWDLGKVYFGDGNHVQSIDLRRANPVLNATFDVAGSENPEQLIGMLPPYGQWIADQMLHRSTFRGADWRVHGKAAPYAPKATDYDVPTRGRIALQQVLSIFYPYRAASNLSKAGTQGDDSLLWSKRPIHFAGRTGTQKLMKQAAEQHDRFAREHRSLLHELEPVLPQATDDIAQAPLRARIEKGVKPKKRKRSSGGGGYFGTSSGGTHYFGAGG